MTSGERSGTSGGESVTSGVPLARKRLIAVAALIGLGILQAGANILSKIADKRDDGLPVDGLSIVLDEVSSLIAWFVCLALVWQVVKHLRPPHYSWPAIIALHGIATVPVSLLHVGLMVLLREAGHALAGGDYRFTSDWMASLIYEYRKDVMSYVLMASFSAVAQWWMRPAPRFEASAATVLEIGEGARLHRVPVGEIDWAEAAGNYVTLHFAGRELLHRTTLTALEQMLAAQGFARIHRSRIVRRAAVRRIETGQTGDFIVTLADGTELRGSRRYREGVGDKQRRVPGR